MKKIILKLRGGLGNQLFMIAYGIGIAKKNHAELFINIDDYQKYKVRNFELNQYLKFQKKIQYDVDNSSKFRRIYYAIIYKVQQSLAYINRKCGKRFNLERMRPLYRFFGVDFAEHGDGKFNYFDKQTFFIFGYFQNLQYVDEVYKDIFDLVRNYKVEKNLLSNEKVTDYYQKIKTHEHSIAVSIRCGEDYQKLGWPICSREYFFAGINYLRKEYISENLQIVIFSDDVEKAKIIFDDLKDKKDLIFIENLDPSESLFLMNICNDYIISNSSFSWWGQKLSDNNERTVIAPQYWFREKENYKENGLYDSNFVVLDQEGKIV